MGILKRSLRTMTRQCQYVTDFLYVFVFVCAYVCHHRCWNHLMGSSNLMVAARWNTTETLSVNVFMSSSPNPRPASEATQPTAISIGIRIYIQCAYVHLALHTEIIQVITMGKNSQKTPLALGHYNSHT